MSLTLFDKFYYLTILALLAGAAYWIYTQVDKFFNDQRIDKLLSVVPRISGSLPCFGHALQLSAGRPWEIICIDFPKQAKSAAVRFEMFRARVLLVTEPPMIQRVLQSHQRKYIKDRNSFAQFMCLLGNGLVTAEGSKWRHGRQLLSSAMRIEILDDLPEIAIDCTNLMLKQMARHDKFDLLRGFQKLTLQVIGRALLSLDPDECDNVFAKLYLPIVDECNARVWAPWKSFMFWTQPYKEHKECLDKLNTYFVNLITDRWERRQRGERTVEKGVKQDILDLYMSQLNTMDSATVLQLRDDLKTMVLAGHETTAAMLTWTTYELLKNPELAEKVRKEHKRAFGDISVKRGEYPTREHLEQTEFTRACLREALRKYSVVPLVMREACEDDFVRKEESGLPYDMTIAKGTAVAVGITSVHRNPTLWPDPDSYKPERFVALDQDMESVQYSFIPFITGPRHCLGQHISLTEAQFIVSYLMANVQMELAPEASGVPHKFVVPVVPEHGLPVNITKVHQLKKE